MPIYCVQAGTGGPVKIGVASDVRRRVTNLQSANHARLVLLAAFAGGREEECALHKRFATLRVRGEWFAAEIQHLIDEIRLERLQIDVTKRKTTKPRIDRGERMAIAAKAYWADAAKVAKRRPSTPRPCVRLRYAQERLDRISGAKASYIQDGRRWTDIMEKELQTAIEQHAYWRQMDACHAERLQLVERK